MFHRGSKMKRMGMGVAVRCADVKDCDKAEGINSLCSQNAIPSERRRRTTRRKSIPGADVIRLVKAKDLLSPSVRRRIFPSGRDHRCTPQTNIIANVDWNRTFFLEKENSFK